MQTQTQFHTTEMHTVNSLNERQSQQPFYALQPNKIYAIQCLVERSRPRSQVAWFNRSSPIELQETVERLTHTLADTLEPIQKSWPKRGNLPQQQKQAHTIHSDRDEFQMTGSSLLQKYNQMSQQKSQQFQQQPVGSESSRLKSYTRYIEHAADGTVR